jgi:hypothetical protein
MQYNFGNEAKRAFLWSVIAAQAVIRFHLSLRLIGAAGASSLQAVPQGFG